MPADVAPSHVYAAALGAVGERVRLDADESHYVTRVCRARVGDTLALTDGRGTVARAILVGAEREAEVEIESLTPRARSRRAEVWCGAPEGQRADWLVEKLGELGVATLQPIDCARASWDAFERRAERWRRLALAALRQSRGAWLLEVRTPIALREAAALVPVGAARWIADPEGPPAPEGPLGLDATLGLIGPAEGFEAGERAWAKAAGFEPMRLAGNRLRCETAALAWAAWWALGASGERAGAAEP